MRKAGEVFPEKGKDKENGNGKKKADASNKNNDKRNSNSKTTNIDSTHTIQNISQPQLSPDDINFEIARHYGEVNLPNYKKIAANARAAKWFNSFKLSFFTLLKRKSGDDVARTLLTEVDKKRQELSKSDPKTKQVSADSAATSWCQLFHKSRTAFDFANTKSLQNVIHSNMIDIMVNISKMPEAIKKSKIPFTSDIPQMPKMLGISEKDFALLVYENLKYQFDCVNTEQCTIRSNRLFAHQNIFDHFMELYKQLQQDDNKIFIIKSVLALIGYCKNNPQIGANTKDGRSQRFYLDEIEKCEKSWLTFAKELKVFANGTNSNKAKKH